MGLHFFLTLLLLRSGLAAYEDSLDISELYNTNNNNNISPDDDLSDLESLFERQTRNNADKFLRFGRAFWDYDYGNDVSLEDKDSIRRPSRTGSLTSNLQQRIPRDKSSFMRFGRSTAEEGNKKKRNKREIQTPEAFKRQENFLRFGRSGGSNNFMRFGRNIGQNYNLPGHDTSLRNKHVIEYLRNLLRQYQDVVRHESDNNNM